MSPLEVGTELYPLRLTLALAVCASVSPCASLSKLMSIVWCCALARRESASVFASGRGLVALDDGGGRLVAVGKYSGRSKSYAGVVPLRLNRCGGRNEVGVVGLVLALLARSAPSGSMAEAALERGSGSGSASPASKKTSLEAVRVLAVAELVLVLVLVLLLVLLASAYPGRAGSVSVGALNAAKSSSDLREWDLAPAPGRAMAIVDAFVI